MKSLTSTQKKAAEHLVSILRERLDEEAYLINIVQEDPETGSTLCELEFETKKATVWVRLNGSISAVNGARILLVGGKKPKSRVPMANFIREQSGAIQCA